MTAFELLLLHCITVLLKWKGMFLINANNELNACTYWGFTLWCVINICALETQVWGSVSFLIYDVCKGVFSPPAYLLLAHTERHVNDQWVGVTEILADIEQVNTFVWYALVDLLFLSAFYLFYLKVIGSSEMTNILFSEAGKLHVAGNKQAMRFKSSCSSEHSTKPWGTESRKALSTAAYSMLLVSPSGSPSSTGCHHWQSTEVSVYSICMELGSVPIFS